MTARPMAPVVPAPTTKHHTARSVPVGAILRLEGSALFITGIVHFRDTHLQRVR